MVWGLVLEPKKQYAQDVKVAYKITKGTLDLATAEDTTTVHVRVGDLEFILCHLSRRNPQETLDLVVASGEEIVLFTKGSGTVHLTGYLIEEDIMEIEDEDEEDEEVPVLQEVKDKKKMKKMALESPSPNKDVPKRKSEEANTHKSKKAKPGKGEQVKSQTLSDEEDEDDVEDSEDDELAADEEDESDDDEEDEEDEEDTSAEEEEEEPKKLKIKTPPSQNVKKGKDSQSPSGKLHNGTPSGTPGEKKKKKESPQTPNVGGQTPKETPQKKTLPGGVMIEDVRIGSGPVAKAGKFVSVYYTGRLKQNNKQFDATTQGPGFKFRLGQNEVIKAWDIGLAGMKVGGKRRVVCPPHTAYGKQGQPPVIPPNSTLVFEVELKNVN